MDVPAELKELSATLASIEAVANLVAGGATEIGLRGQVVIVRNPGITEFFADVGGTSSESLYFLPHPATVVLG